MKTEGKCQERNKKEEEGKKMGEVLCTEGLLGLTKTGDNQIYLQRWYQRVNAFDVKQKDPFLWPCFLSFAAAGLVLIGKHCLCCISRPRCHPDWDGCMRQVIIHLLRLGRENQDEFSSM